MLNIFHNHYHHCHCCHHNHHCHYCHNWNHYHQCHNQTWLFLSTGSWLFDQQREIKPEHSCGHDRLLCIHRSNVIKCQKGKQRRRWRWSEIRYKVNWNWYGSSSSIFRRFDANIDKTTIRNASIFNDVPHGSFWNSNHGYPYNFRGLLEIAW